MTDKREKQNAYHRVYYHDHKEEINARLREKRRLASEIRRAANPEPKLYTMRELVLEEAAAQGVSIRTIWRQMKRPTKPIPEPVLLLNETCQDAADRLGLSVRTIYRRLKKETAKP